MLEQLVLNDRCMNHVLYFVPDSTLVCPNNGKAVIGQTYLLVFISGITQARNRLSGNHQKMSWGSRCYILECHTL